MPFNCKTAILQVFHETRVSLKGKSNIVKLSICDSMPLTLELGGAVSQTVTLSSPDQAVLAVATVLAHSAKSIQEQQEGSVSSPLHPSHSLSTTV